MMLYEINFIKLNKSRFTDVDSAFKNYYDLSVQNLVYHFFQIILLFHIYAGKYDTYRKKTGRQNLII